MWKHRDAEAERNEEVEIEGKEQGGSSPKRQRKWYSKAFLYSQCSTANTRFEWTKVRWPDGSAFHSSILLRAFTLGGEGKDHEGGADPYGSRVRRRGDADRLERVEELSARHHGPPDMLHALDVQLEMLIHPDVVGLYT